MSQLSSLNGFHGTSVARTVRWRTEAKGTYHHESSTPPRCLPSPDGILGSGDCLLAVHQYMAAALSVSFEWMLHFPFLPIYQLPSEL